MASRIPDGIGHPLILRQVITVKDLHRQDAAPRSDAERPVAAGRGHAGARRSMNIVPGHLVKGELEPLGAGIVVVGVIVGEEKVAPDAIPRRGVRVPPDPRPQIGMLHVYPVIQDGNHDGPPAHADLPRVQSVHVLAILLARDSPKIPQMPLGGRDGRHGVAAVFRNEVGSGKDNLLHLRPVVGHVQQIGAAPSACRMGDDDLIGDERVGATPLEAMLRHDLAAPPFRDARLEAQDDFMVHGADQAGGALAEHGRRRASQGEAPRPLPGRAPDLEKGAGGPRHRGGLGEAPEPREPWRAGDDLRRRLLHQLQLDPVPSRIQDMHSRTPSQCKMVTRQPTTRQILE